MPTRRTLAALAALLPGAAAAQPAWPERPIRWIVPFPPAGTADIVSRILGERVAQRLGQPVLIENRAGAGGTLAAAIVAQGRGDMHLVMVANVSHAISPALFPNIAYNADTDFAQVAVLGALPMVIAVNPAVPAHDLPQLIALARAQGAGFSMAYGGNGTASHLIGISFHRAAGISPTFVPYRGANPALTDVIAGTVPSIIETLPAAMGHIRAGRLRALAVSSPARSAVLPDVATFSELGLGAATGVNWFNFMLPAGLPPVQVARWSAEIRAVTEIPEVKARFDELGLEGAIHDPAEAQALVRAEIARWAQVVRSANIQAD
jgi:tripartite-type tricarboxylate transporter receptor subunit TctC